MNTFNKFLRYVAIDTCAQEDTDTVPSTDKQKDLSRLLAQELIDMGAHNVSTDQHGYVYATIPANCDSKSKLGFIAHVDTSPAVSGANVKPVITRNYDGNDINMGNGYTLSPIQYPSLLNHKGETVICTDGTTLLGADDKAGVAEIMQLAYILLTDNSIQHGTVQIAFTPDEEVGHGPMYFDIPRFNADFAYTIDGGRVGEIEFENFNAASARITITGVSIHPGTAKGKMINSLHVAHELHSMLPVEQDPAYTEKYEGFYHLTRMQGVCDNTIMSYIIRDHDRVKFEAKKQLLRDIVNFINIKYGPDTVQLQITEQYRNMREMIEPNMHLIDNAVKAMQQANVQPIIMPIRGGTDGAQLSFRGLPCPNLCTGGYNFHGRYEYITQEAMDKVVEILLNLVKLYK
ncbi:MAG: peptidase T [Clostridia bacterium]|nr:peptidase T [Clostridia bacterium]